MHELRLVAVSEDGSYAVLVVPGRSGRFALPIDERLRTVARGQFSRLAQYEIEVESPLRPKEIQDRIRAGETAEEIADAAGLPVDRIRRFEGPVLAEREFRAKEAQQARVRGEAGPGPRLGEIVTERLAGVGASADDVDWDSRKRQDGNWHVQLAYTLAGRMHLAEWVYDPRSKHVTPDDDEAIRLCLSESEWPEPRPVPRDGATATVTPIGSRAASAGGHQASQPHQAEQRGQGDWPSGRGALHPSMQQPTGAAGAGPAQAPGRRRAVAAAAEHSPAAATGAPTAAERAPAGREAAQPREERNPLAAGSEQENGRKPAATGMADGERAASASGPGVGGQAAAGPAAGEAAAGPAAGPAARQGRRASGGRSRRSSVPSWDEIMFGNSRQPD